MIRHYINMPHDLPRPPLVWHFSLLGFATLGLQEYSDSGSLIPAPFSFHTFIQASITFNLSCPTY